MRLVVAACLAFGVHTALYWAHLPWVQPTLIVPESRAVSINLVSIEKTIEKPPPPKPKVVRPKPEPKRIPKPRPKPAPPPKVKPETPPRPEPIESPSIPEPFPEEIDKAISQTPDSDPSVDLPGAEPEMAADVADTEEEWAVVQASVPLYDLNPPPRYPRAARKRNYQGTVMLDVRVTTDGSVAQVRIAQSSGYAILDRSAVKSVKGWRFSPALRAGRPIEMWVEVPVRFELH